MAVPLFLGVGIELADVDDPLVARQDRLHHFVVVGVSDWPSTEIEHEVDGSFQLLEKRPVVRLALDTSRKNQFGSRAASDFDGRILSFDWRDSRDRE